MDTGQGSPCPPSRGTWREAQPGQEGGAPVFRIKRTFGRILVWPEGGFFSGSHPRSMDF